MADPTGDNKRAGEAIRNLMKSSAKSGSNTLLVTHKTNIADALGKEFGDLGEGEIVVLKVDPSNRPSVLGRIKATEWKALANQPSRS